MLVRRVRIQTQTLKQEEKNEQTNNMPHTCTQRTGHTVKPVKRGHSWYKPKVSLIERFPHSGVQCALRTPVWD
jgi:hypothetical protein